MMDYRLSLLGGFGLEVQGEPLTSFESDKVRALLAYLAVENGQPHRRDKLIGLLWPDSSEKRARHSLSQALYSLKSTFSDDGQQPCLAVTPQEIRFRSQAFWLDVEEFQSLIKACEAHNHQADWACRACLQRLERAASLYLGDFLAGLNLDRCGSFDEWLRQKRYDFREQTIVILDHLARGYDLLGDLETALFYARKRVDLDPLNEEHHRQVMQLHARLGQRNAALVQYEACCRILSTELGVEPEVKQKLLNEFDAWVAENV